MKGMHTHVQKKAAFMGALIAHVFFVCSIPLAVYAKNYDHYVDASVSKSGDGSKKKPFKTVREAAEEGGDIFISNGKYHENIVLEKKVRLFGETENGVVISGEISMGDDTKIQSITVRGMRVVITVEDGADAEIDNCTITDFGKVGIMAVAGKGEVKVTDTKITNGDGKGLYIERGRAIELTGNEITNNDEEGIDIRSKVNGSIKNNTIAKNGESGLEVIVGSADLRIEGNVIKRNGSSGIATQFYPDEKMSKSGQLMIFNNTLEDNKKYGLDCNKPQGGAPSVSYWRDSIELAGNDITDNEIKSINDYCDLIDAVDEDEKSDNIITEDEDGEMGLDEQGNNTEPTLSEEERKRMEMEESARRALKEQKIRNIESLLEKSESLQSDAGRIMQELVNENTIKVFFLGFNKTKINVVVSLIDQDERALAQMDTLIRDVEWDPNEEIALQEKVDSVKDTIDQQRNFIAGKQSTFNVLGWLKGEL